MTQVQRRTRKPESPWGWIGFGMLASLCAGVLFVLGISEDMALVVLVGYALAAVGGIAIAVGVIAVGVKFGIGLADYERDRRSA